MVAKLRASDISRILLVSAAVVCAVGMIGPFQGIERKLIAPDKAAHFIAFYGLTTLAIAAFPKARSLHLAAAVLLVGPAIEVVQLAMGRSANLGDVAADTAGVAGALFPMFIKYMRRNEQQGFAAVASLSWLVAVQRKVQISWPVLIAPSFSLQKTAMA